jgi:hypothetical protein
VAMHVCRAATQEPVGRRPRVIVVPQVCISGPARQLGRFIFSGCLDTKLPREQTCMKAISQHPNKTDQISGSACLSPCLHAHAAAGSDFLGSAPQPSGGVRPFLTYPSCCLSREGRTEEYAEAPPACRAHAHMKGKKERSATRLLLSHNTPPGAYAPTQPGEAHDTKNHLPKHTHLHSLVRTIYRPLLFFFYSLHILHSCTHTAYIWWFEFL